MTTYSLCMFAWELDILEIRLAVLDSVVDYHVIVESPMTHAGAEKPLVFHENRDRFAQYATKIEALTDDAPPEGAYAPVHAMAFAENGSDHWRREHHQRDALSSALASCADDDLILASDCDEIPDPARCWDNAESLARSGLIAQPVLALHSGRLRWRWPTAVPGTRTRFMTGQTLREHGYSIDAATNSPTVIIGNTTNGDAAGGVGWHLAYMGGVEEIQRKLASFAHQELNTSPFNDAEHIERCLETGADLFDRPDRRCELCSPSDLPDCIQAEHLEHLW